MRYRIAIVAALFIIACDPIDPQTPEPDGQLVEQTLRIARPGPMMRLPDHLLQIRELDETCPTIEVLEFAPDGTPTRERWGGGCEMADGTLVDGELEWEEGDGEQWLAGEAFTLRRGDEEELIFDGVLEIIEQDELLLVETAATWCGGETACQDGAVVVDLSYSIYPADTYPEDYDITMSGVVTGSQHDGAPIKVEGSWSVHENVCADEPTDGVFALRQLERHDLTLDGALTCDGCASWIVQGLSVPDYCGVEL